MSIRYGASLVPGAVVFDTPGLGVLGSVIRAETAEGTHGPGLLYLCLDSGDDDKEFRWGRVEDPSGGVFRLFYNGSFLFSDAADGTYRVRGQIFADGVDYGTTPASEFRVGNILVPLNIIIAATEEGGDVFSAALSTGPALEPRVVVMEATEDGGDVMLVTLSALVNIAVTATEEGGDTFSTAGKRGPVVKVWDGTAWIAGTMRTWDGTSW